MAQNELSCIIIIIIIMIVNGREIETEPSPSRCHATSSLFNIKTAPDAAHHFGGEMSNSFSISLARRRNRCAHQKKVRTSRPVFRTPCRGHGIDTQETSEPVSFLSLLFSKSTTNKKSFFLRESERPCLLFFSLFCLFLSILLGCQ